jgi:hypothetical protein
MQKSISLVFLILIGIGFVVFSCRKLDNYARDSTINNDFAFFNKHRSGSKLEEKIIAHLRRKNEEQNFVDITVQRLGYPIWHKMLQVEKGIGNNFRTNTTDDSLMVVFIPFAKDSQNVVNASLQISMTPTDTSYKYICRWQYTDSAAVGLSARQQSVLLMQLNKNVFGNNLYKITDSTAFGVNSENKAIKYVRFNNSIQSQTTRMGVAQQRGSRTLSLIVCYKVLVQRDEGQLGKGCPPNSDCSDYVEEEQCETYFFTISDDEDNGAGSIVPPISTGGGGGSSTNLIPPSCSNSIVGSPASSVEECPYGWEPAEDEDIRIPPCTHKKLLAGNMTNLHKTLNIDSILSSIPNLFSDRKEKGFPIYQKIMIDPFRKTDTSIIGYSSGSVQIGTDSSITIQFSYNPNTKRPLSWLHTHPDTGYAAHSPLDIYQLIEASMNNVHMQGTFVAASNGDQYAITITNRPMAYAFLHTKAFYLKGSKWDEGSAIGKAFKEAWLYYKNIYKNNPNKNNLAYEMAMAAVLEEFKTGITLNKKDANGNFNPIVVITSTPNPNKPKQKVYTEDCL